MDDKERFQLFYGPYEPPLVKSGKWIACGMRGKVRVGSPSNGLIPWPRRYRTNSLILCGDLVRAVKLESVQAVAHYWGVCVAMVQKWRRVLGVSQMNTGTREIQRRWREELHRIGRNPENAPSRTPKKYVYRRGKPSIAELHSLERRGFSRKVWTPGEEKLLGKVPDKVLAGKLRRSVHAVSHRRSRLGITNIQLKHRPWSAKEDQMLGKIPDHEIAQKTRRTTSAVRTRRELLHIPIAAGQRRLRIWSEDELSLLGKFPDPVLARKFRRTVKAVANKRVELRLLRKSSRTWSSAEIKVLGMKSDQEVARELGRSIASVAIKRRVLRIPSPAERPAENRRRDKAGRR